MQLCLVHTTWHIFSLFVQWLNSHWQQLHFYIVEHYHNTQTNSLLACGEQWWNFSHCFWTIVSILIFQSCFNWLQSISNAKRSLKANQITVYFTLTISSIESIGETRVSWSLWGLSQSCWACFSYIIKQSSSINTFTIGKIS